MKGVSDLDKRKAAMLLEQIVGIDNVFTNEPMKDHTSFKLGGPADILVTPCDTKGLIDVLDVCSRLAVPVFIMGNGTNLIIRYKGIRGVVIKLRDKFSHYELKDNVIEAQAGILLSRLAKIALEYGLSGLEFAEGIPGTLGGAVTMNAGAYDGEMSMVVESSEYLGSNGQICVLDNRQHCFGKRSSFIQTDGGVVLSTRIKLNKGDPAEIKAKMDKFNSARHEKQPLAMPSAGSIFKRPDGYFAGKLIQDCGLRGFRIGGAEVSGLHCGFIVNNGNATANDVIELIKYIQTTVHERFGVELQTEVKVVGEE